MKKTQNFSQTPYLNNPLSRVTTLHENDHTVGTYWTITDDQGSVWEKYQMTPDMVAVQLIKDYAGNAYPILCRSCQYANWEDTLQVCCEADEEKVVFDPEIPWPVRNCGMYAKIDAPVMGE